MIDLPILNIHTVWFSWQWTLLNSIATSLTYNYPSPASAAPLTNYTRNPTRYLTDLNSYNFCAPKAVPKVLFIISSYLHWAKFLPAYICSLLDTSRKLGIISNFDNKFDNNRDLALTLLQRCCTGRLGRQVVRVSLGCLVVPQCLSLIHI